MVMARGGDGTATSITVATATADTLDALRAENADLRRQLEDFRAGYLRRTNELLIALDALQTLQAAQQHRELQLCRQ